MMSASAFSFGQPADNSSNEPAPFPRGDTDASSTPPADNELFIRKAFETDARQGCELLFRQYFAPLCSHAIRFVYDRQVAEDIVADIFFTFYTKGFYQQVKGSYRAYLYQAVRNRAYNSLRWELGRQESLPDELDQADTEATQPDRLMQQNELYWGLEQAVQQLSPQRQRVFLMSRFEGKSYKEIALALHLAPKTVENHLLQAIAIIRQSLRQQNLISWGLLMLTSLL
jgi:RNA polymerase sigma-70 factor (ECF subfamily)